MIDDGLHWPSPRLEIDAVGLISGIETELSFQTGYPEWVSGMKTNRYQWRRTMRYIIHLLIIALSVLTLPGLSVAKQPEDSQSSDPEGTQFKSSDPVRSDGNPLIAGRRLLKKGFSHIDLDTMYAARSIFERALNDSLLSSWGHYYVGLADYRIANVLLARGKKRKADASDHLEKAVEHLQIAIT